MPHHLVDLKPPGTRARSKKIRGAFVVRTISFDRRITEQRIAWFWGRGESGLLDDRVSLSETAAEATSKTLCVGSSSDGPKLIEQAWLPLEAGLLFSPCLLSFSDDRFHFGGNSAVRLIWTLAGMDSSSFSIYS
jgi:hypothetical protein